MYPTSGAPGHIRHEDDHGQWDLVWVLLNAWLYQEVSGERLEGLNRVLQNTDSEGPTDK